MPFGSVVQPRTATLFAGRLRHRINIVTTSPVQDSTGGTDLNNTLLYATVWASVEALQGDETFAGQEQVSKVTHQIVIRYIGAAPSWQPISNYLANTAVIDSNGNLQIAVGAGTSGSVAPTWNTALYGYTSDGDPSTGVTWKNLGPAPTRSGVNAAMQVVWQGRKFQISAVLNPDGRKKFLALMCVEIGDSSNQSPVVGGIAGGGIGTILDGGNF
jgi:head-tail adaptor